jgi:ketosteroid isomerase-like protein
MRIISSFLLVLTVLLAFSSEAKKRKPVRKQQSNPRIEIQQVLSAQQKSWNEGKIEAYMQGYWNNDSLTFVGKKGVTRGWKNTLANYKKSYPDKTAMGKLNLELISIKILGKDIAFVVGKWNLTRSIGDVGGHFTLLMRNIKGKWVIVADHSS